MEIVETKSVKINLKKLIEDLVVSYESNDEDGLKELQGHFDWFMQHTCSTTKEKTMMFILNNKTVTGSRFLTKYFKNYKM